MIHLTLAIADFMMILIMAALGAMGWIVVGVLLVGGVAGGAVMIARRLWRRRG